MGTAITLAIVAVILFFALRSTIASFSGGSSQCSSCGTPCGRAAGCDCPSAEKMLADVEQAMD